VPGSAGEHARRVFPNPQRT